MPRSTPATPKDALELATATHLAGRRVDMGTLARELGVGRATLYRWFGSREELLEQMLLARARTFIALAREQAGGAGDERLLQTIRIVVVARNGRLRSFSAAMAAGKISIWRSTVRKVSSRPSSAKNASGSATRRTTEHDTSPSFHLWPARFAVIVT